MRIADVSRKKEGCLEVDVLVSPRSNRSGPEGFDQWRKRLILRVKAPPLDGRANKEVEETFSQITGMPSSFKSALAAQGMMWISSCSAFQHWMAMALQPYFSARCFIATFRQATFSRYRSEMSQVMFSLQ